MNNLVSIYNTIDPATKETAKEWYRETHNLCREMSNRTGYPLDIVCAVFSALSPGTNFEQNKKDCLALLTNKKGHLFQTYKQNVLKAKRIKRGELLPGNAFSLKTGPKTYNFYYNLLEPSDPGPVTIDRHAYRIATGKEYKALTPKQYREIAEHYTKASKALGVLPNQLQAVLWVDYRNKEEIKFKEFCPF